MADKRLGRGLDFLISRTTPPVEADSEAGVSSEAPENGSAPDSEASKAVAAPGALPVEAISPNPFQPRREFDADALADLEASIQEHGVLQAIVVREATVLGMLGVASLGAEVVEVRARHFYDELLLLIVFGVGIVLLAALCSYLARSWIRRAR